MQSHENSPDTRILLIACSYCRFLSQRRPAFASARFAYSGRPVVVTDGQRDWTAAEVLGVEGGGKDKSATRIIKVITTKG